MKLIWLIPFLASSTLVCAQTPEQRILTYKQYASIQHKSPYILEFKAGSGALLLYGAEHTGDPKNLQIADIERRWAAFQPTVAVTWVYAGPRAMPEDWDPPKSRHPAPGIARS